MLILELLIILFLFLGPPICTLFGWSTLEGMTLFTSVHPILYLLLIYTALKFNVLVQRKFYWKHTLIIVGLTFLCRILFQQDILLRLDGNLLVPLLFSFFAVEISKNNTVKPILTKWFIFLFLIEVLLAIYERITSSLLFPYTLFNPNDINGMIGGDGFFRSNSLLGHPLSNALCISIVLAFISTSNIKKYIKYSLLLLGFISLLCFNARFAIMVSFASYFLYYLRISNFKFSKLIPLIAVFLILGYIIVDFNLGDRLLSQGLQSDDSSILARFDVFDMLRYVDYSLIIQGSGLDFVEQQLGMLHIENWILIMVFDLGLLVTLYYIYLVVKLAFNWIKGYDQWNKVYLFGVFIIIASSNNSLATQVPALSFFIAASLFFSPNTKILANQKLE